MSNACIDPSGLHLRRELTALRKARVLRDPETSSSWRSPLSSRSLAATSNWNHRNATKRNSSPFGLFQTESTLPLRSKNNCKKVFLYNWRQQSSNSSDCGTKPDHHGRQGSAAESPEDSLSDIQRGDSKSDTYLENPTMVFRVSKANFGVPTTKKVWEIKKNAVSKKKSSRTSISSEQLDLPSDSLGVLKSVNRSDDTDYCNSEELRLPPPKFTKKRGYPSHSASPLQSGYENGSLSSKLFKNYRMEDSSCSYTPASTSSCNRYVDRCPSTVDSWDITNASFDADEIDQLDLMRGQGCGIPCYWSKRTKHRGCGSSYSPSLSDTLRRKGSSIFCGSQTLYKRRPLASKKQKRYPKSTYSLPLLTNGRKGCGSSTDSASDELSTNFGELDLEASSRLNGRRWSTCRSQDGIELTITEAPDDMLSEQRNLSQKYRPRSFSELVGQNIVVQSLSNAILKGRIAPVYLFQGPRGTGKTSAARIFSAALNCLSTEGTKPCGLCRECTNVASGKSSNVKEVDATNKTGLEKVRYTLKNLSSAPPISLYKIFIINECHILSPKTWFTFLKYLEEPPSRVVFIFITAEIDSLPQTVMTRCQKYLFSKIKDADMVTRLKKLAAEEKLEVESNAVDLIISNSDGSLRDAEMMLDQLSLLGRRITTTLVNDLVGVVSDERLLDVLELAMSSDTAETVKKARELLDSGVDPMALMSQLAGLIMDIIAGTYRLVDSKGSGSVFAGRSLTEAELERLKRTLHILSAAEKQLRHSSERSTWFMATLLQLGSGSSSEPTHSSSSSKQSLKKTKEDLMDFTNQKNLNGFNVLKRSSSLVYRTANEQCSSTGDKSFSILEHINFDALTSKNSCTNRDKLDEIWRRCIEKCHSKTLKQLLCSHGKLQSILKAEGILIAYISFRDEDIKSRAERFLSSITNSIEIVLRHNVEVRIELIPCEVGSLKGIKTFEMPGYTIGRQIEITGPKTEQDAEYNISATTDQKPAKPSRKSFSSACDVSAVPRETYDTSSFPNLSEEKMKMSSTNETRQEIQMERLGAAIDEQRLETAWLQAAEKGTPKSLSRFNPEKNQVLPQDDMYLQNEAGSIMALTVASKNWVDGLNSEINGLKIKDSLIQEDQLNRRNNQYPMSPSLLHTGSFAGNTNKRNLGYESGPGCNGFLCWKTSKSRKGKVKQGTHLRTPKPARFQFFGERRKSAEKQIQK